MIKKYFDSVVKDHNERDLTVTHLISTEKRDRQGDIVRSRGMCIYGRPVVLVAHGHHGEPWAKPIWVKPGEHKGQKGILAKTQFYPDETGRRLWHKTKENYMPSWSIGFRSIKDRPIDPANPSAGTEYLEFELLEYSMVAVPANPDAITIEDEKVMMPLVIKMIRLGDKINDEITCAIRNARRKIGSNAVNKILRDLEIKYGVRKKPVCNIALQKLERGYGIKR